MTNEDNNFKITVYGCRGSRDSYPNIKEVKGFQEEIEITRMKEFFMQAIPQLKAGRSLDQILSGSLDEESLTTTIKEYIQQNPLPFPRVYGGTTTCLLVETPDNKNILLDMGSGAVNAGQYLLKKWKHQGIKNPEVYVLGSHSHRDHISGADQNELWFHPGVTAHFYGNKKFLDAIDLDGGILGRIHAKELDGLTTPLTREILNATFLANEFKGEEKFAIGNTQITIVPVNHPTECNAYVLQHGKRKLVFCTDHEYLPNDTPRNAIIEKTILKNYNRSIESAIQESQEKEKKIWELSLNAELLYRDAPYSQERFFGEQGLFPACGFGHSMRAQAETHMKECGIKRLLIGHHEPFAARDELEAIDKNLREKYEHSWHKASLAKTGDYHIFGAAI